MTILKFRPPMIQHFYLLTRLVNRFELLDLSRPSREMSSGSSAKRNTLNRHSKDLGRHGRISTRQIAARAA